MSGSHRQIFIYKYLNFDSADELSVKKVRDILVESKLYLSAPSDFNDPYDFRAQIEISRDAASLRENFQRSARLALDRGDDAVPHIKGRQRKVEALASRAMERLRANPHAISDAFERARERNGVACFSEDPRGLLMWAHYGAGHTGVCLQFDVTEDPGVLMITHKVRYREQLPVIEYPIRDTDIVDKVILNKGRAWEAEQEIRYVSLNVVRGSIPFDSAALRGIILGARLAKANLPSLLTMVEERKERGMREPVLYRAHQDRTCYGLTIKRFVPVEGIG